MSRGRLLVTGVLMAVLVLLSTTQAFAATGDFVGKWGEYGTLDAQFKHPAGVAIAPNGDVYVADMNNHRIQYFSSTGTYKGGWGSYGNGAGEFSRPYDVAIAPNGDVYVADSVNHRIQYFSSTGTPKGTWGALGPAEGQFDDPIGLAIAPNGDVYVADTDNNRIQHFGPTGTFLGKWGSWGTGDLEFRYPEDVAVAPNGDVYVVDSSNDRVQYFSPTGALKGTWGSEGVADGQLEWPSSIAVSPGGSVYVVDTNNHRIQYFNLTGDFKGTWSQRGSGDGQFEYPWGIAVAPNGNIYVSDSGNDRVQRFEGVTVIQHDAGAVTFSRWVSGYNAAYSGGGYVYSPWAGSALEFRFVGSSVTWFGPKQPSYGKAEVFVDGVSKGIVDCYASVADKTTGAAIWKSGTLADGSHTLKIVPTGTKNAASTGTAVVLDRFEIDGANPRAYMTRHDDETGSYAGSWIKGVNAAYIGKSYRYSKYPSASFTKTFNGTRVAWIGPKTGAYGRAKVYIDGKLVGTVSQYGATGWRYKVWESASLPAGNHTIKIVPTGTKDAASKSTNIVIDAIDVRQ